MHGGGGPHAGRVAGLRRRVAVRVGVEPGGDQLVPGPVGDPPLVDLLDHGGALRVEGEAGLVPAFGAFHRHRVRDLVGQVAVGGFADVVPGDGVLTEPAPGFLLELQPEPFRDALLDPADEDGGRVRAGHVDGLIGGEQRDPREGQFLFQFERVERVPAGPLDVFADDGGETRRGAARLGEQVGEATVAGDADIGELLVPGAVPACVDVQAAGLDVPIPGGDVPAGRQLGAGLADLPAQRRHRVLHLQGGDPAGERDGHPAGGFPGAGDHGKGGGAPAVARADSNRRRCRCIHDASSFAAAACRISHCAASGPDTYRISAVMFSLPVSGGSPTIILPHRRLLNHFPPFNSCNSWALSGA